MRSQRTREHGFALIPGLLLLMLLSALGVASLTRGHTETTTSGQDLRRQEAFFAAEIAVSHGELMLSTLASRVALEEESTPGHVGKEDALAWKDLNWTGGDSAEVPDTAALLEGTRVTTPPRYVVHEQAFHADSLKIGQGPPRGTYEFKVYGHGEQATKNAVVETRFFTRLN